MRILALLLLCLTVTSCDDPFMINQPKRPAYRAASVGPGPVPPNIVAYRATPDTAPPLTLALLERGQARYDSFCAPCHAATGDGHGMVVQRGFPAPDPFDSPRLRAASTQHFVDVMTNGYGVMYAFDQRITPADRWAIAAYLRALQQTSATVADLSPAQRAQLEAAP